MYMGDNSVHFDTERSDPVKKHHYLLALFAFTFLLLCACAKEQPGQASAPDTFSSVPTSSVPTTSIPVTSVPTTSAPIQLSTDWLTENREIIPFEERFKEDVPFGTYDSSWLVHMSGNDYRQYSLSKRKGTYPLAVMQEETVIYETMCDRVLDNYYLVTADGLWAYLSNDTQLIRVNLFTGESTTLEEFSSDLLRRYIWGCGKDTVCIYTLDQNYHLRYYYRDLHSDTEKNIYEGTIPATPLDDMVFYRPETTQGRAQWRMMNPDFYEVLKKELGDPDSPFRTQSYYGSLSGYWEHSENFEASIESAFFLCIPVQNHYDVPARVEYAYDPKTGELLADYGIVCSCERGTGQGHDHFDYEITKEETPEILNVEPTKIPNIITLTEAQAEAVLNQQGHSWICEHSSKEFGYPLPYRKHNGIYTKLADISITEMVTTNDYSYCITTENTIIQLNHDGQICNTIYSSDNTLDALFFWSGNLYFIDGKTIICIDTVAGTWRPILRTTLKELYINGEYWDCLYFGVRQGMYCQEYTFDVDTGVLKEESYI